MTLSTLGLLLVAAADRGELACDPDQDPHLLLKGQPVDPAVVDRVDWLKTNGFLFYARTIPGLVLPTPAGLRLL